MQATEELSSREKLVGGGRLLGEGAFASVYAHPKGNFAIKIFNNKGSDARCIGEMEILDLVTKLRCKSLLMKPKCEETAVGDDEVEQQNEQQPLRFMKTELLLGPTLFTYICSQGGKGLPELLVKQIVIDIVAGLSALHYARIVHADIKPENIVFTDSHHTSIKICDYGNAMILAKKDQSEIKEGWDVVLRGTIPYSAPETLGSEVGNTHVYSRAQDLWSLGCVLYCMLSAGMPFCCNDMRDRAQLQGMVQKIVKGKYGSMTGPQWHKASKASKDLVARLLVVDRRRRMTIEDVMSDPWLAAAAATVQKAELELLPAETESASSLVRSEMPSQQSTKMIAVKTDDCFKTIVATAAEKKDDLMCGGLMLMGCGPSTLLPTSRTTAAVGFLEARLLKRVDGDDQRRRFQAMRNLEGVLPFCRLQAEAQGKMGENNVEDQQPQQPQQEEENACAFGGRGGGGWEEEKKQSVGEPQEGGEYYFPEKKSEEEKSRRVHVGCWESYGNQQGFAEMHRVCIVGIVFFGVSRSLVTNNLFLSRA